MCQRRHHHVVRSGVAPPCGCLDYGPAKPTGTPPGARTMAMVTPSITRSGGSIATAPSRSAFSNAARASATCTEKLLPGGSDGLILRIPPPPLSEYANRWYSPPPGMGKFCFNVQPGTSRPRHLDDAGL